MAGRTAQWRSARHCLLNKKSEWFAYQSSTAYEGDYACPWTQLGYTYDWHHGASRQGLSEYIATYNSLALIKRKVGSWTFVREEVNP